MTAITHHIPEDILIRYATGQLDHAFSLVVASHVSMCLDCRAALEALQSVGGALLETAEHAPLSSALKADVLARLDQPTDAPVQQGRSGVYPGPVMQALKGHQPRWKPVGMGVRQTILYSGEDGTARLLYIPPGQAVPDHGHRGLELTLVLQGSFYDETGRFGVGDLEVASDDLEHTPIAGDGAPCICLAATEAPLRFTSIVPRLVQPFIRI